MSDDLGILGKSRESAADAQSDSAPINADRVSQNGDHRALQTRGETFN